MTELNLTRLQKLSKILLIGDSCTDEYKIGTVERISPEAPVPVIKIVDSYTIPGMASNVYKNMLALGVTPEFVTNTEEITKTRFIDKKSGQHLLRVDNDGALSSWTGNTSMPLDQYDAVVISDYNKGFLTYDNIEYVIRNSKGPVFIDTKKTNLVQFDSPRVYVKINELEYKSSLSCPEHLIVTMGEQGALYTSAIAGVKTFPTDKVEVVDVCGCGDTFLAALSFGYLLHGNIEYAIMFANKAASITVQHRGNYAPTIEEIRNAGY